MLNHGPSDVTVTTLSSTQLQVQWTSLTDPGIVAYVVLYRRLIFTSDRYQMIGTDQTQTILTTLKPGTEYILRVLAYTMVGNGAASDLTIGTTVEACE